jgi:sortase family protein
VTRRLGRVTVTVALVGAVAGCGGADPAPAAPAAVPVVTSAPAADPGAGSAADAAGGFKSPRTYREVAEPVRIRIPGQRISSKLAHVGLAADGSVAAPTRWEQAAWYDRGPRPGQQGPAVIVGHVDSKRGPAVFFRLTRLRRGDDIYIDQADGRTAHFTVTRLRQFAKNRFPADLVYSNTLKTSLQLLTCGGVFDQTTGHYRDNIVVSAVPA